MNPLIKSQYEKKVRLSWEQTALLQFMVRKRGYEQIDSHPLEKFPNDLLKKIIGSSFCSVAVPNQD